uniref:GRAM domain containing 4 n=1 Tax=Labrus bergylta TaxID=56723 RepID=A0A3Q3EK75_9LABR
MRRHLDRIRFRGQRRDEFQDLAESPNTSDTESTDDVGLKPQASVIESVELREAGPGSFSAALQDDTKTDLNEVKGHLEIALLEKHFLQEELKKLKEESNVDSLRQELEKERSRCLELEQKVNDVLRSSCPSADKNPVVCSKVILCFLVLSSDKQKDTLSNSCLKWLYDRYGVYIEDFRFQPEEHTVETEEPLSAKSRSVVVFPERGFKPVTNFMRNLSALSSWYSVYTSAIAFIVYMYAACNGWAIPMFLFLAILRLSLNYLIARGWRIQWSIVPEVSEPVEPPKEDLTVSEKFQLVLDVAQKAQNLFGRMANILEKIKNLFMWVQPELTQKLYIGLWVAFISSCLLPYKLLGFIIGVYAGIKFFIIDFIFKSCPKLRHNITMSRRVTATGGRGSLSAAAPLGVGRDEDGGRNYSTKRGAFHEVFSLPESERPLSVCENGWRCCLINRDRKTPTDYIRNGVLYVTERDTESLRHPGRFVILISYICLHTASSCILAKIIRLYKVLSVLPGSGMGISIATPSTQKPMVFGAMIHRDEAFDAINTQYAKINALVGGNKT